MTFVKAYTVKRTWRPWFFKLWIKDFDVIFEEQVICSLDNYEQAVDLAAKLNGAFNLGRASTLSNPLYI